MKFEHPELFLLLVIVPLMVVAAILAARGRGRQWQRLVAARLRPILVQERPRVRRWVSFAILLFGFFLLIVAMTAPHAGYRETPETIRGRNILLAVDVSRSMLAEDEAPSRLAAARAAALELLDRFPNDRVGVIAFSARAWLHTPLTIDHDALRDAFQQLEFQDTRDEWIPRGGSDLSRAVQLAIRTVRETGQRTNALIVLSDGESHTGDVDGAAEDARAAGLTIFSAGFGTNDGDFIPDPRSRDGKLHDRDGNLVLTRLQSEPLALLARRTGGFYTKGSGRHFSDNLELAVQRLDQYELEGRTRQIAIPRFQWFLVPSMVLFVVGILLNTSWRFGGRPATALLVALFAFSPASRGTAALIPRTQAEQAYEQGQHQRALDLFAEEIENSDGERKSRLHLGEAAAAYRLGEFQLASRAYSGALLSNNRTVQEQAHFGLGNTQFFKGLKLHDAAAPEAPPRPESLEATILYWQDAIGHFEAALSLNPDNIPARENRDLVKKRLEELQKEKEKQENQPQDQPPPSPEDPPPPDQGKPPPKPNPDQPGQPSPSNQGDQEPPPEGTPPPDPPQQPGPENPGQDDQNKPAPDMKAKPGESPEEYARRILEENADFEGRPVPMRLRPMARPEKDW